MFGKILGAIIGVIVGLVLQSALMAVFFGCVGLVLGHLLADREDEIPPEKLKSIDELLGPATLGPEGERPRSSATPQAAREGAASPTRNAVPRTNPDVVIARLLCPIFIEVARSDAPVSQAEIRIVREYFKDDRGYDEDALEQVRIALKKALGGAAVDLAAATKKARAKLSPADRPLFVNALYELALVDSELKRAESDAIKQVVGALNMSDEQLQQITSMHLGSGLEHYRLLGLTETATDDELRSAFRKLAAEWHPDKYSGKPKREVDAAAARFREITDAWAELRKLRGL